MDLQKMFRTEELVTLPEYQLTAEQANHVRVILIEMSSSYCVRFSRNAFKMKDAVKNNNIDLAKHLLFECLEYIELWYKMRGIIPHSIYGLGGHWDNYCEKTMSFGKTSDELLIFNKEVDGYASDWDLGKEAIREARTMFITGQVEPVDSFSEICKKQENKYKEIYDGS